MSSVGPLRRSPLQLIVRNAGAFLSEIKFIDGKHKIENDYDGYEDSEEERSRIRIH